MQKQSYGIQYSMSRKNFPNKNRSQKQLKRVYATLTDTSMLGNNQCCGAGQILIDSGKKKKIGGKYKNVKKQYTVQCIYNLPVPKFFNIFFLGLSRKISMPFLISPANRFLYSRLFLSFFHYNFRQIKFEPEPGPSYRLQLQQNLPAPQHWWYRNKVIFIIGQSQ